MTQLIAKLAELTITSILLLFIIFIFFSVILPTKRGVIPFVPTKRGALKRMLKFADIKEGDKLVDLGSGDGRLVIKAAKLGAEAHGFEINPLLVFWSRIKIKKARVSQNAFIHKKDFWEEDLSRFDIITIYGLPKVMNKLEKRFSEELKLGTKIISNSFPFPNWQPKAQKKKVYLYQVE